MKKKVVFGAGVMALVAVGATGLVFSMNQEREKAQKEAYAMEKSVVPVESSSAKDENNASTKDYGEVVTYKAAERKEQVEKYVNLLKENPDSEGMAPDQVNVEIPTVYEYRNHKVYFVCKNYKGGPDYLTPEATDTEAEKIVKKAMDLVLDGMQVDVTEDTFVSLSLIQFQSDEEKGKIERRYLVEVQSQEDIDFDQSTCGMSYDAISGDMLSFNECKDNLSDDTKENKSDLKKWPNTGKAAEGKYGDVFGRMETDEDKQLAEEYTEKINQLLTEQYGLSAMKEVELGVINNGYLELYYDQEDGGIGVLTYDLNAGYIQDCSVVSEGNFDEDLLDSWLSMLGMNE